MGGHELVKGVAGAGAAGEAPRSGTIGLAVHIASWAQLRLHPRWMSLTISSV